MEYALTGTHGPVVLYIHGTPGGWDHVRFSHPHMRTLAPSRPGYLRTPAFTGQSPEQQAHAYAQLLDACAIERVIVMTASGGGPSGLCFASLYPARTRAVIAIESITQPIRLPPIPHPLKFDFSAWLFLKLMPTALMVRAMIPAQDNQARVLTSRPKLEAFDAMMHSLWPPSLRQDGVALDVAQFATFSLPSHPVTSPALIIHGDEDRNVPFTHAEHLATHIPQATLHRIHGGDHFMPITHAEELRQVVLEFIDALRHDT